LVESFIYSAELLLSLAFGLQIAIKHCLGECSTWNMDATHSVNLSRLRTLRPIVALFDSITILMDVPCGTLNRLKGWKIVESRT
jgi:hypothetical protein